MGGLLAALLFNLGTGAPHLSPTHDELAHIPSGVAHLRIGQPSDFTHPPLARLLIAVPLLILGVDPMDTPEARAALDRWDWKAYGRLFLFHNRTLPPEIILLAARASVMVMTAALGLVIWTWARRRHGPAGGLVALFAFCFSPTVLAHGRLCTTDMPLALFGTVAVLAVGRSLRLRTLGSEALAGTALGVALLVKFSAVMLLPAAAVLWLVAWRLGRRRADAPGFARAVLRPASVAALAAALTVWAGFGFQVRRIRDDPLLDSGAAQALVARLDAALNPHGVTSQAVMAVPIPAYDFWKGLGTQVVHNFRQDAWMHGSQQYLDGRWSETGWWYYFPLAFVWKTALPLLVAFLVAIGLAALGAGTAALRAGRTGGRTARLADAPGDLDRFLLAVPPIAYAAACLTSTINIGHRYLLPIYPFLFVALGGLVHVPRLSTRVGRLAGMALGAWLAIAAVAAWPDHLSYFNELAGGSRHGWRRLSDSNVDWGQDLWRLRQLLADGWTGPYHLDVHTSARPTEDLGLGGTPMPRSRTDRGPPALSGLLAISATQLVAKHASEGRPRYWWLLDAEPFARVGNSVFLYWLDRGRVTRPPPRPTLGAR